MSGYGVHAVSLDSRNRVSGTSDANYAISLGKTFDRVKSVQLASFQFQDLRHAIPNNALLFLSEPMTVAPNTRLIVTENVTTLNKTTNVNSVSSRSYCIVVPPSVNPLTNYIDAGSPELDTLSTLYPTGLRFGVTYQPLVNQRMFIAGGNFPTDIVAFSPGTTFPTDAGPLLVAATVRSPYTGTTGIDNEFQYVDDYMTELTGGAGGHAERHYLADNYTSYVVSPKPTITEFMIMLNAALGDLSSRVDIVGTVAAASFTTPVVLTSAAPHGLVSGDQVVVSDVRGNLGANGTFFITVSSLTTFSLDGSVGSAAYAAGGSWLSPQRLGTGVHFGIDDAQGRVKVFATPRDIDNRTTRTTTAVVLTGSVPAMLGFADSVSVCDTTLSITLPFNVQTYPLRPGTYTSGTQLAAMVTDQLQVLEFFNAAPEKRRFVYSTSSGWFVSVLVETGFYTGPQLAAALNVKLTTIGANLRVRFSITTRKFTLTDRFGQFFILDMTIMDARFAFMLGFHPLRYSGANTYTSDFPIINATFGIASDNVYPTNAYVATASEVSKKMSINVAPRESFWSTSGTYTANVEAAYLTSWNTLSVPFAHRYDVGDVLYAQVPVSSGVIQSATAGTPVVCTALAHGLISGDRITILGNPGISWTDCVFTVMVVNPDTFELVGSSSTVAFPGDTLQWMSVSTTDGLGNQVEPSIFTVVVKRPWDPSVDAAPTLTLQPTPTTALFNTLTTSRRVVLHATSRNVFQLHFAPPESVGSSLGFPVVTWPPSTAVGQTVLPSYGTSVAISSGYTSPFAYTLLPSDYILMRVEIPSQSNNTHVWGGQSKSILAKLYATWPFLNVSEELNTTLFARSERLNEMTVSFENPDGSPVQFNGIGHTFTLLITCRQDAVSLICE